MVIDTSAVVAAVAEADGRPYLEAIQDAGTSGAVSAVSLYETRVVLAGNARGGGRFPPNILRDAEELLRLSGTEVVPFDRQQAILAHQAYLRFGKGNHPAKLNFADCAAYALAQLRREPLLFKGNDFSQTDVTPAL